MKQLSITVLRESAQLSANDNGPAVDLSGYTGLGQIVLNSSATNTAGNTADLKLQDSPDGSTWTDTGDTFATVDNSGPSAQALYVNFDKFAKYVRVASAVAGTSPQVTLGVLAVGVDANQ